MLGAVLFNIFINDLDDGTECTFSNLTYCFWEEESDGFTIIQRYLKRMEKEVKRNIMKFNRVLHLGRNNYRHQDILG